MSVCYECCVLLGRGLCDGPITRPEECGVSECDNGASILMRPWPTRGCCTMGGERDSTFTDCCFFGRIVLNSWGFAILDFFTFFGFGPFIPGKI